MKFAFVLLTLLAFTVKAQTKSDCENNINRSWWDVKKYDLTLDFGNLNGHIKGKCIIGAKVIAQPSDSLQLDLDKTLQIKEIRLKGTQLNYKRSGNRVMVHMALSTHVKMNEYFELEIIYSGRPVIAKNPPWKGGFIIKKDSLNIPWLSVSCQTEGASIWFPCKNYQGDEAEEVVETYIVPSNVIAVGNGRLVNEGMGVNQESKSRIFTWQTNNTINNYDITFYIGDYVHWRDTLNGKKGKLTLDYYALRQNQQKAALHFKEVSETITCFEEKMGPYPFYSDGYKIVEAPFAGMEHQSAIAYGNNYMMGYDGYDMSGSGTGMLFDYIIVHESAHEWFGNSITAADRADNWIHEGFASYAETIYAECMFGKEEAFGYQAGKLKLIRNFKPVQGTYNTCADGGTDNYYKAAQVIHMVRIIMNQDSSFWGLLKALNWDYYHKLVYSRDIEDFISKYTGIDLSKFFDQYLRHTQIPVLEIKNDEAGMLECRYINCIDGFDMPLDILIKDQPQRIFPKTIWSSTNLEVYHGLISESSDFLVKIKFPEEK